MAVAIFFLLALIVAAFIAYPLLPGRAAARPAAVVSDGEIEQAVQDLRRNRARGGSLCPACAAPYRTGDRFCVQCGGALPAATPGGVACPSCGATIHQDDVFCSKCGHNLAGEERA